MNSNHRSAGVQQHHHATEWVIVAALFLLAMTGISLGQQTHSEQITRQLEKVDRTVAAGPFHDDVPSLSRYQVPDWFRDAKFGIFIHWGGYSVPAYANEWYPRNMYQQGTPEFKHQVETYGPQSKFGYKDFLAQFKGERFNAAEWVSLFRRAGAHYMVPVAEHHDGFAMYDTQLSDWTAMKLGPHRDVIGELAQAARQQNMHFGLSYHRAEHWWFFDGGRKFDSDVNDPQYQSLYGPAQPQRLPGADHDNQPDASFLSDWLARSSELVDKYHPDLVYFDWWVGQPAFRPYLYKFAAYYYDRAQQQNQDVVFNYKEEAMPEHTAVLDVERGNLAGLRAEPWQMDTSVSWKSWGYIENDSYRTPESIIKHLVDIVSKNGCLLLDVGPKSDGTIPEPVQRIVLSVGDWLAQNGEAIYGTRPWKIYGEGPTQVVEGKLNEQQSHEFGAEDIRFTTKGGRLYAIGLGWPQRGTANIKSLAAQSPYLTQKISSIALLGTTGPVKFEQDASGLHVHLPAHRPNDIAYVLRIKLHQR